MKFQAVSAFAAALVSGSALASIVPPVTISITGASGSFDASPVGVSTGTPDEYGYDADINATGFLSTFSLVALDNSTSVTGRLGGVIAVTNTSASVQEFTINLEVGTTARGTSSLVGGSVGGTLIGDAGGGSFLSPIGGGPIWRGFLRNGVVSSAVGSMWPAPVNVSSAPDAATNIPADSFGVPIPGQASAVPVGNAAIIQLHFQLGAGDTANLSTVFVYQGVPAPGAMAAIALAAASTRRRRR